MSCSTVWRKRNPKQTHFIFNLNFKKISEQEPLLSIFGKESPWQTSGAVRHMPGIIEQGLLITKLLSNWFHLCAFSNSPHCLAFSGLSELQFLTNCFWSLNKQRIWYFLSLQVEWNQHAVLAAKTIIQKIIY